MSQTTIKIPRKGAGRRLRDTYEKNRGNCKPSKELLEILKDAKKDGRETTPQSLYIRSGV